MNTRCLAVVLAGGAGSRVGGADKGLLVLRGRALIDHVLHALRAQCDESLIVANRNVAEYSRLAPTVSDEDEGHAGPLAGIVSALAHVAQPASQTNAQRCEWLLTVPVDCPHPPFDLRKRLQSALVRFDAGHCAFAHDGEGAQPLFAIYRLSSIENLLSSARAALASHASVVRWHDEISARAVDFSRERAAFHNLNTPRDFRDHEHAHV